MLNRSLLFKITSLLSIAIAVYHLIGVFYSINSSPPWRHFIFACVCLFCGYGFTKRPKYFVYFFFALVAQQYYSHGSSLWSQWFRYAKIDWISLALLTSMSIILYNLIVDAWERQFKAE